MGRRRAYRLVLVGGEFDGAPGLHWQDDGNHPVPEKIVVGWCSGIGTCQAGVAAYCYRLAGNKPHIAFWTEEEYVKPERYIEYVRTEIREPGPRDEGEWTAFYYAGAPPTGPEEGEQGEEEPLTFPAEWVKDRPLVTAYAAGGFIPSGVVNCRCALVPAEEATRRGWLDDR